MSWKIFSKEGAPRTADGQGWKVFTKFGMQKTRFIDSGTTLPTNPYDGQEFNLIVDATKGIVWTFRYRAASASTYKWEFIGGPPTYGTFNPNSAHTAAGWSRSCTLAIPGGHAGEYLIKVSVHEGAVAATGGLIQIQAAQDNSLGSVSGTLSSVFTPAVAGGYFSIVNEQALVSNGTSADLVATANASTFTIYNARIQIIPIRIS